MYTRTVYGFIFSFTVNVIAESLSREDQLCPYTYHVIEKNDVTWSEASLLCKSMSSQSAVLIDEAAHACVYRYLHLYDILVWTAGVQLDSNWTWITGTRFQNSYFLPEPNKQCAAISATGVLQSWHCSHTTRWYLCQLPPAACVGDGIAGRVECYLVYSDAGVCVLRCHNQTRWHEARNLCLDKGGDLISLEDGRLKSHVMSRIERDMGDTREVMWIGLTNKLWAWNLITYNQTITYSFWDIDEPKEESHVQCLAVTGRGQHVRWRSLDCDATLKAILCQADGNGSDSNGKPFHSNRTEVNDRSPTADWLSNDLTVILLSVSASVIFVLLVIVISLIVCLRNARRINVLLGSRPKTYFDYFDFGFRRKLPPIPPSSEYNRTVVLTNSMLSSVKIDENDSQSNEAYI